MLIKHDKVTSLPANKNSSFWLKLKTSHFFDKKQTNKIFVIQTKMNLNLIFETFHNQK